MMRRSPGNENAHLQGGRLTRRDSKDGDWIINPAAAVVGCQLLVRRFGVALSGHAVNNLDCKLGALSADPHLVPRISLVGIFHHQAGLVAAPATEGAVAGFSHGAVVGGHGWALGWPE
jgi:hypothetical protein